LAAGKVKPQASRLARDLANKIAEIEDSSLHCHPERSEAPAERSESLP
jgi:hypothetical protein